jgi:hypothetical protein
MLVKIQKELRFLRAYAVASAILFGALLFLAFTKDSKPSFAEIDVERINIVEKDGSFRLVISNKERSPGAIVNGRLLYKGGGRPGMIFFNSEGDECGGLTYNSGKKDGKYSAFGGITFDRYDQDQAVGLQYSEHQGKQVRAGLTIWDRPDTPITEIADKMEAIEKMQGEEKEKASKEFQEAAKRGEFGAVRLFAGSLNETATVSLKDSQSRDRLRLCVDSSGAAKLEFLNEKGEVIFSLPPKE